MKRIWILLPAIVLIMLSACQTIGGPVNNRGLRSNLSEPESSSRSGDFIAGESGGRTAEDDNLSMPTPDSDGEKPVDAMPTVPTPSEPSAPRTVTVTIPEGYTFMQIAEALEKKGVCTAAKFYKAAQSYQVKSFSVPSDKSRCFHLEGYLFPDTYEFYLEEDPVEVLRKILNNYAARSGTPSDKTLILASILEKEARSDENMRLVSSVFHNRLKKKMKLQADSTREYVNMFITGNKLVASPSKYAALYNTYKCVALPAGPICNPGARAIDAALNPVQTNYLYFFFGNDNQNHYSETLEEHEQQKEQYGVQFK